MLAVNGATVSGLDLDLDLMQSLFSQQKLQVLFQRDDLATTAAWPRPSEPCQPLALPDLQAWTSQSGV